MGRVAKHRKLFRPNVNPKAMGTLAKLRRAGFDAYLVGGCVRDALYLSFGDPKGYLESPDWDIATDATARQVRKILGGRIVLHAERHRETVFLSWTGTSIEVTPYRNGAACIEDDLARRDFTVNAVALDLHGRLLDPFGGVRDIRAGVLRAVEDPVQRFREDGLRILRGLRFAAVFGWEIEPETASAMRAERELLSGIAEERIGAELVKMLCGARAPAVMRRFADVLAVVVPEIGPTVGFRQNNSHHHLDVWEHTLAVVETAPNVPVLRLAALLHDLGKPECHTVDEAGRGHFYGHAARSADIAQNVMSRLRFSDDMRRRVVTLVEHHGDILTDAPSRRTVRRMMASLGVDVFHDLLALRRADIAGPKIETCGRALAACAQFEALLAELEAEETCFSLKDLAVRGGDIMELGYRGPDVGIKLRELLEAVLEERVPNKREALIAFWRPEPSEPAALER